MGELCCLLLFLALVLVPAEPGTACPRRVEVPWSSWLPTVTENPSHLGRWWTQGVNYHQFKLWSLSQTGWWGELSWVGRSCSGWKCVITPRGECALGDDASEHLHTQPVCQENSRMERIKGEKTSLKTRLETACRVWLMQGGHQGTGSPLLCASLTLLSLFDFVI